MALKGFKNTSNLNFSNADGDGLAKALPPSTDLVGLSTRVITLPQGDVQTLNVYTDGQTIIRIFAEGELFQYIHQLANNDNVSITRNAIISDDKTYIEIPYEMAPNGIQGWAFMYTDGSYVYESDKWIWSQNPFTGASDPIDDSPTFTSEDLITSYVDDESTLEFNVSTKLRDYFQDEGIARINLAVFNEAETEVTYYDGVISTTELPIRIADVATIDGGNAVAEIDLGVNSESYVSTSFETPQINFDPQAIVVSSCLNFTFRLVDQQALKDIYGEVMLQFTYSITNLDTGVTTPNGVNGSLYSINNSMVIDDFTLATQSLQANEELTGSAFITYFDEIGGVIDYSSEINLDVSDCPQGVATPTPEPVQEPVQEIVRGCTDSTATNYNADAVEDDGSCLFVGENSNTDASNNFDVITDSMSSQDEYGDLIDDTILVIQQLQTQLDNAPTQAEVEAIEEELEAANLQLTTLSSAEGLLANLENYVALAEAGNYNGQLANVADVVIDGKTIVDASVINTSLTTISNNFDTLGTTTAELNTANGILDSIAGVLDITTGQGEQAYLDALNEYASDPTLVATEQDVTDAYNEGVDSVEQILTQSDITAALAEGQAEGEALFAEGTDAYNIIFNLGEATGEETGYATGYTDGAASVTPEDGVTQADVTQAFLDGQLDALDGYDSATAAFEAGEEAGFEAGVASVTFLQTSYDQGVASVTPEDGITQEDVDIVQQQLDALAAQIVTAQTALTSPNTEIQTLITNAQDAATTAAQLTDANEGVVTQDAYDSLVNALNIAEDAVNSLETQLETLGGDNANLDDAYNNLQAQLDLANELLIDAEADNTAYAEFLQSLTGDLGRLEQFLVDNYDYTPYQSSSITAQAGNMADGKSKNSDGSANENFLTNPYSFSGGEGMATGLTPRNQVFVNFRGYAKHVKGGFAKFKGQAPMSTFKRADGDDDSNKLNKTTKTGIQILGVAVGGYILYKLLGKK